MIQEKFYKTTEEGVVYGFRDNTCELVLPYAGLENIKIVRGAWLVYKTHGIRLSVGKLAYIDDLREYESSVIADIILYADKILITIDITHCFFAGTVIFLEDYTS